MQLTEDIDGALMIGDQNVGLIGVKVFGITQFKSHSSPRATRTKEPEYSTAIMKSRFVLKKFRNMYIMQNCHHIDPSELYYRYCIVVTRRIDIWKIHSTEGTYK